MLKEKQSKVIVLLSGGMDSTICLYWAKEKFYKVSAISFYYGQRHKKEISSAIEIAKKAEIPWGYIDIDSYGKIVDTALTRRKSIYALNEIPNTFVPNRNLVFFSLASAYGSQQDIYDYVGGMCQTDFSGYYDCRRTTLDKFEEALSLSLNKQITIWTPLMGLTKTESLKLAQQFDGCMDALALTHTCYLGNELACGECPACKFRLKGFKEAGLKDPIKYKKG